MSDRAQRDEEREVLLQRVVERLEGPMVVLGFVWLVLLVFDLVYGLSSWLTLLSSVIWLIFIVDFILEFIIAPRKVEYVRHNWLMILALFIPALRVFRLLQVTQALQGARLVQVLSSITRGMHSLGASLGRHGFRYVVFLTLIVTFAGAAGMYAFEHQTSSGPGLRSYLDALWWTAMIMTTLGSGYWPHTPEGRILCLILSLYAFSIFGYITAALATFLVGREAGHEEGEIPSAKALADLQAEVGRLREEIRALAERMGKGD